VYFSIRSGLGVTAKGAFANPNTIARSARDPLTEFKKGIKRDPSLFPILKDEKQWDTWRHSTVALACAQDMVEVLNPAYHPSDAEQTLLFTEKQKYMYAVFERTLLTDQDKAYV